jgi:ABC-type bacteriocin/lantibiotic exporter with double-glycine peptidase domain
LFSRAIDVLGDVHIIGTSNVRTRGMSNSGSGSQLGRLISTHGTSPATLQRAAVVAILSFFFFLAMLLVFYFRQQIVYFVLSTAFLIVYVFTLIGWILQRRNVVSIHENGIAYRRFSSTWDEIKSVKSSSGEGISLEKESGESVTIGKSVADLDRIALEIRTNLP